VKRLRDGTVRPSLYREEKLRIGTSSDLRMGSRPTSVVATSEEAEEALVQSGRIVSEKNELPNFA